MACGDVDVVVVLHAWRGRPSCGCSEGAMINDPHAMHVDVVLVLLKSAPLVALYQHSDV